MIALALSLITGKLTAALRWIFSSTTAALATLCLILAAVGFMQHRKAVEAAEVAREAIDGRKACAAMYASAVEAGNKAKADAEANYQRMALNADQSYQAGRAAGSAAVADYIAAHRMLPIAQAHPASPAKGGSAGVPEKPTASPELAQVIASEADIKTCDVLYDYASSAHNWAQGFLKKD
jgi:hypothetical protein